MITATASIRSQLFLLRKLITSPAVLKITLTIEPIRPGRSCAILDPRSFKPFPTPFATELILLHMAQEVVNNVSRALVSRLKVKFAGEILIDTDSYDLFKLYEDLFLTQIERASMLKEGIQSEDLSKIRCNAGDKKTSGVDKEKKAQ